MKKKWLTVCAALLLTVSASASNVSAAESAKKVWTQLDEPSFSSTGHAVAPTADGGWVYTGDKDRQLVIHKLRKNGTEEWEYTYSPGLYAKKIIQTADGGYLAVGQTPYLTDAEGVQAFAVKVDAEGQVDWQYLYGGKDFDQFLSVVQAEDGYWLAGSLTNAKGKAVLIKLDLNGGLIKELDVSAYYKSIASMMATADQGLLLAGIDYAKGFGRWGWNTLVVKLDANGKKQWSRSIEGEVLAMSGERGKDIFISTRTWDSVLGLYRMSDKGTVVWKKIVRPAVKHYMKINGYDLVPTSDGGVIVVGDTGPLNTQYAYLIKFDKNGKKMWDQSYFSANSWILGIAKQGENRYAITGHWYKRGMNTMPKAYLMELQISK